ncbi:MAG: hypothetical protein RLZZ380_641 [Actinomycetota bacterium]|jgi:hypothetical protein
MTTANKPAAPRAAAAKTTTTRTAAAKPAARPAARAAAKPAAKPAAQPVAKAAAVVAPTYEFTKPYKFLTGFDDSDFCGKVSAHLNAGYKLAGSATMTTVNGKVYVGQPVFKASNIAKPKPKAKAKKKK